MENLKDRLPPLGSLVAFEAAARCGSYTLAAQQLEVTPAAISRQISRLEAFLGTEIFRPHGRGRSLTDEGRELFEAVAVSLEHVAGTVAKIRQQVAPTHLTIATPLAFASLWLIPRIASFRREHPDIELRVVTADKDIDPAEENISLAVRYGEGDWPHLSVTPLLRPDVFPVCSPGFLRLCGGLSSVQALLDQTLLDRETEGSFGISWNSWFAKLGTIPGRATRRICFNSYEIIIRAALAGQGVALGVNVLVDDLLQQKLLVRPLATKVHWNQAYYLVSPAGEKLTPAMKLFADWILAEARNVVTPPELSAGRRGSQRRATIKYQKDNRKPRFG